MALPTDIRNPLRQILGFAGVLAAQGAELGAEEIRQVGRDMGVAGFRLARKVTQMRIRETEERGERVDWVEAEAHCDAETVLRRAVKQCVVFGSSAGALKSSIEPGTLMIREGILSAVLAELLDNAHRYSAPASEIKLIGEVTAEGYKVSIENQSHGVLPDRLTERLGPSVQEPIEGSQYSGLTVVRKVLELCKIEPGIECESSGRVLVHFTIPVAQLF